MDDGLGVGPFPVSSPGERPRRWADGRTGDLHEAGMADAAAATRRAFAAAWVENSAVE